MKSSTLGLSIPELSKPLNILAWNQLQQIFTNNSKS
jgi:hypothetical protein